MASDRAPSQRYLPKVDVHRSSLAGRPMFSLDGPQQNRTLIAVDPACVRSICVERRTHPCGVRTGELSL
jgi:hypothetical protein